MYISLFVEHTIFLTLEQGPLRSKAESCSHASSSAVGQPWRGEVEMFSRQGSRLSLNAVLDEHPPETQQLHHPDLSVPHGRSETPLLLHYCSTLPWQSELCQRELEEGKATCASQTPSSDLAHPTSVALQRCSVPLADPQGACPAFLRAWSELLPRLLLQEQGTGWMGLTSIRSEWDKPTHSRHSAAEGSGPRLEDSTYSIGCGNFLGSI